MNKRFQRGLIVGKFSPLHRGHELVIRRAFDCCAEVVILSYSNPEFPRCEAERREKWLAELFPTARRLVVTALRLREWFPNQPEITLPANDALELVHRRFTGMLCLTRLDGPVDAVFTSEDYGDGFAEELTRLFRERDAAARAVQHVLVDRNRAEVPASGTAVRADVEAHRQWLSPAVYASFVRRVCLLGGESSGKSTLAEALAREFQTAFVPEYGRELWESKGGRLVFEDLLRIGEQQIANEEAASRRARGFLFCDTSPLTTLFYSLQMFQRADPRLEKIADRPYDLVVLCGQEFPFVQDGTRQDAQFRDRQHQWYLSEFAARGMAFVEVSGSVAERVEGVGRALLSSRR